MYKKIPEHVLGRIAVAVSFHDVAKSFHCSTGCTLHGSKEANSNLVLSLKWHGSEL